MTAITYFLFIALFFTFSNGAALMSIDFGNEFMKIGVIKSGSPMEIALDPESQRKSPTIVAFKDGERLFGTAAENAAAKNPKNAFRFLPSLLGKTLKHPVAIQYASWFPYHDLSYHNGSIVFKMKDVSYNVEELISMLIESAKDFAQTHVGEKIKSAVIAVPSYWSQSERNAMLRAASIVDVDVLQIINSNSAVALNFGIFRKKFFNSTSQYYMFYDVGSQDTTVTVVSYKHEASEDPELAIIGVGYDQTLGTNNLIQMISKYLVSQFQEKYKLDPTSNMRSMSKFLKESKRVLKILSANNEVNAQIENVHENKDFAHKITRKEFEDMAQEFFERLDAPFIKALSEAQLSIDTIQEVILMGGGTRIPKVQETILTLSKKPMLGKSINSDEAAAMGALYQAAYHSPLFKVLKFNIKDFNNFPISSSFEIYDEDTKEKKIIDKTNLLFKIGNPFPQKRALSITKHLPDIKLKVFYPNEESKKIFGTDILMNVQIPDFSEKIKAQTDKGAVIKGLKVHFYMDINGILSMTGVDAKLEIPAALVTEEDNKTGTLKSISDKISSFFGKDSNDTKTEEAPKEEDNTKEDKTKDSPKADEKPKNNSTKPIQISEPLEFTVEKQFEGKYSEAKLKESQEKMESLRSIERNRKLLEKTKNDLESFIFSSRENLESKDFIEYSTEDERKVIQEKVNEAYNWYEEQGNDTPVKEFEKYYADLKAAIDPVENRRKQFRELPKSFEQFKETIKLSKDLTKNFDNLRANRNIETFYPKMNFSLDFPMVDQEKREGVFASAVEQFFKAFPETEITTFEGQINDSQKWLTESEEKLAKSKKNANLDVTVEQSFEQVENLVRRASSIQEKISNQLKTLTYEFRKQLREMNMEKVKEAKEALAANNATAKNDTSTDDASEEGVELETKEEATSTDETKKEDSDVHSEL